MRWIAFLAVAALTLILFPHVWPAVALIVAAELIALAYEKWEAR